MFRLATDLTSSRCALAVNPRHGMVFSTLLWLGFALVVCADELTLPLARDGEISVQRFGEGRDRLLWLPSEFGFGTERELPLAKALAAKGLEIWIANLHASYFIPPGRSSLTAIPIGEVAELIRLAQPVDGKLYVVSAGRGAALSLMAARELQLQHPDDKPLGGLILFHPNLYARPPQPGHEAAYLPIARLNNQPIYLFQPGQSANRWYLRELIERLEQGGSDVFAQIIPNVSDGFHLRPDFTDHEAKISKDLPRMLYQALQLLNTVNDKPRNAQPRDFAAVEWSGNAFKDTLQPFPGAPPAPSLMLTDSTQRTHELNDYLDKVVLVNFWTTWCPPCVEEIPSLGRLQEHLSSDGFVVLSVAVGETRDAVTAFLRKTRVRVPVLLDPEGITVRDWDIHAFPTSFLLDRQGRIRYACFGALEWDGEDVEEIIRRLL